MSHHDKPSPLVERAIQRLRDNIARREATEDVEALKTVLLELDRLRSSAPSATLPAQLLDQAADIYNLMLRSSKSCRPMEHLLTTDGLYHLNIANLHVRSDGREYVMEADWAKLCGKLVKAMNELRDSSAVTERGTT